MMGMEHDSRPKIGGPSAVRDSTDAPRTTGGPRIVLPEALKPHFQEYDVQALALDLDADLIIQRTLEFGTWEEVRWLFAVYGGRRLRSFLRELGQRLLSPVAFNYWRRLLRIHLWRPSPFPTTREEVWPR
jgi:hypothetical protein